MIAVLLLARPAGSSPFTGVISLVIFFLILRATAMDLSHLESVLGEAVRDALRSARITEEQAAPLMGMDLSALRKCLRGEGRLQLGVARLMRLPYAFWLFFAPSLMYLVAKQNVMQIADDFGIKRNS